MALVHQTDTGLLKITDREFQTLVVYVKKNFGVDLTKKRVLIEGRMTNMLRDRGFTSFGQYLEVLFKDASGQECTTMLNKLTTNYSFFMREPEHYNFLNNVALPALVSNRKNYDLRIWSAGCSAGQEAYTMAMVINEFFGSQKSHWDTTILATDISMNALTQARAGIYADENIKDIPEAWRKKYFVQISPTSYQVCEAIRNQVVFRTMNLMDPFQIKRSMDIIFCRNVMIYFDPPTKVELVRKFYQATAEGGYFCIGHSESIDRTLSEFRYIKPAIYQRGGRV